MKNRKHHRQQQKWLCIFIREVLARSRLVRLPITATRNLGRPPRHRPATAYPTAGRCEQAGKDWCNLDSRIIMSSRSNAGSLPLY